MLEDFRAFLGAQPVAGANSSCLTPFTRLSARGHRQTGIPVKLHSRKVLGVELFPMAGIREMTLPRCFELQWQREVIERWLNSSDTPLDARPGLLDMLSMVKEETEKEKLEAARAITFASTQTGGRADNRI